MEPLLNQFWNICLLRSGPQDLPASYPLLKFALLAYIVSGLLFLLSGISELGTTQALLLVLIDVVLLVGLSYLILRFLGLLARFTQTLTALAGVGTILQVIALPLGWWFLQAGETAEPNPFPALLWMLLLIWSLAVTGHILRHAFSVSFPFGVMYALGYMLISWTVAEWVLPATGT